MALPALFRCTSSVLKYNVGPIFSGIRRGQPTIEEHNIFPLWRFCANLFCLKVVLLVAVCRRGGKKDEFLSTARSIDDMADSMPSR